MGPAQGAAHPAGAGPARRGGDHLRERPNVTSDAFGMSLKSGNAAFLRGSSAAISSNRAVAAAIREALAKTGLPEDALVLVEDTSRESAVTFMRRRGVVDVLIPRGGPSLIAAILEPGPDGPVLHRLGTDDGSICRLARFRATWSTGRGARQGSEQSWCVIRSVHAPLPPQSRLSGRPPA
jgi:hypothetical protein